MELTWLTCLWNMYTCDFLLLLLFNLANLGHAVHGRQSFDSKAALQASLKSPFQDQNIWIFSSKQLQNYFYISKSISFFFCSLFIRSTSDFYSELEMYCTEWLILQGGNIHLETIDIYWKTDNERKYRAVLPSITTISNSFMCSQKLKQTTEGSKCNLLYSTCLQFLSELPKLSILISFWKCMR